MRDEALGPKEGNKITSSQYDLLHLPEGSGWTQPERHKWTYHKTESEISQDEFVRGLPSDVLAELMKYRKVELIDDCLTY